MLICTLNIYIELTLICETHNNYKYNIVQSNIKIFVDEFDIKRKSLYILEIHLKD